MKHTRTMFVPQNEDYEVNDIIAFDLTEGEQVEALAVKQEDDGMLFIAVDCLKKEYQMTSGGRYDYENSIVRAALNGEIIARFPEELRQRLVPFENGDLLRIPTEKEIFGTNEYGENEPDTVQQFEAMKLRRNRIALQGSNGDTSWYWLKNRTVSSAPWACYVGWNGGAYYWSASSVLAVRPLFKIRNR